MDWRSLSLLFLFASIFFVVVVVLFFFSFSCYYYFSYSSLLLFFFFSNATDVVSSSMFIVVLLFFILFLLPPLFFLCTYYYYLLLLLPYPSSSPSTPFVRSTLSIPPWLSGRRRGEGKCKQTRLHNPQPTERRRFHFPRRGDGGKRAGDCGDVSPLMTFGYFAGVRNFGCSLVGDVGYSPLRYFGYHSPVKDCFYSL